MPRTEAFLAHNAIPVQFTPEDFDQVLSGNFVTKVIYLPDPEYQELALAGVETLVSTRLDPGVDPIVEADRRGAILAIVRLGNKDLQVRRRPDVAKAAWPRRPTSARPGGGKAGCAAADGHARGRNVDDAEQLHRRRQRRRSTACRCAARRSACLARPAYRWECRPACRSTWCRITRTFICRNRPKRYAST